MRYLFFVIVFIVSQQCTFSQVRRYVTNFEGGILTYGPASTGLGFSFHGINAMHITERFTAGLGLGYEKYMLDKNQRDEFKVLPLYVQSKYIIRSHKAKSLFGAFDLGYGISLNKTEKTEGELRSYNGGLLASPQVGFLWYTKDRKTHFTFSVGYKYQKVTEKLYVNWFLEQWAFSKLTNDEVLKGYDYFEKKEYGMNRMSVMLGFGF